MASTPRTPRRGLPRVPGGEPWPPVVSGASEAGDEEAPPEGVAPGRSVGGGAGSTVEVAGSPAEVAAPTPAPTSQNAEPAPTSQNAVDLAGSGRDSASSARISEGGDAPRVEVDAELGRVRDAATDAVPGSTPGAAPTGIRRGLPRESGGEPWPRPAASIADPARPASARPAPARPDPSRPGRTPGAADHPGPAPANPASATAASATTTPATPAPATTTPATAASATAASATAAPAIAAPATAAPATPASATPVPATAASASPASATAASATPASAAARTPLAVPKTVWPGAAASAPRPARSEPKRIGPYTPLQWLGSAGVLGVFALALAGIAVLFARFMLGIEPGRDFLAAFPGEYPLPEGAPVGLPVWLNWSHFLNSFFLLFIIRSGWQVRREKRPAAFWSPRKNRKRRISLALWFHQAIDILWIANGVIFIVLLFATGQWMRIVPTSWEVFPNAVSAALQYVSLDWPTENGWVNYNSLQQLSYFAITFVAAPLAILSGVRLSGVWPKDAEKLNRLYPVEWARKIHFPVMLFFVAFIVVHVALVLATGALRNLNHMYAARGAVDPGEYTSDPTGLLIFAASLLVMAAGWVAARPAVLVPIARVFGDVKQR